MKQLNEYIQKEKNSIVDIILFVYSLFVILPVIASISRALIIGFKPIMFIQIGITLTGWTLFIFRKRVSYLIKTFWIIFSLMSAGAMGVVQFSVIGNGMTWMIIGPILATLLFSVKVGILLDIIGIMGLFMIGAFTIFFKRIPSFNIEAYLLSNSTWVDFVFSFGFITTILIVAVARLNRRFRETIEIVHTRTKEVEAKVEERTKELAAKNEQLLKVAEEDYLTKVLSRRGFFKHLQLEFEESKTTGFPLSILMLDVDFFKNINDTYGHFAGDVVLIKMAALLKDKIRKNDLIGRFGGEEFAILLPNTSLEDSKDIAENLRSHIERLEVIYDNQLINSTVSIGIASKCEDGKIMTLLNRADQALYSAKKNGRNRVEVTAD